MTRLKLLKLLLMGQVPPEPDPVQYLWATEHKQLASPSLFSVTGRRLNHFAIGSDPEFALTSLNGQGRVEATRIGLKVGLAAGCDQNERLVELRPAPSPSVAEHVAGILTALRWMYRVHYSSITGIAEWGWRAGAFFAGDGMGGHVHFGRKRPTRTEEVAALDGLARVFRLSGLFPVAEWNRRMHGDTLGQHYGMPGDMRVQRHGYEYRSLPSWLQSPIVAFIVLATSKLAVIDPTITTTWLNQAGIFSAPQAWDSLRGLAKLYKSRDDDAYILYHILTNQGDAVFNVDHVQNFAPNWGFTPETITNVKGEERYILPAMIEPTKEEVVEVLEHLLMGVPLQFRRTVPSFKYTLPTTDYIWTPLVVIPSRRSGFGDLIHNLVTHNAMPILWDYGNHDEFMIMGALVCHWTETQKNILRAYYPQIDIREGTAANGTTSIRVPKCLCQTGTITGLRTVLLHTGMFPIWTVESVTPKSAQEWLEANKKINKRPATWRQF